MKRLSLIILVVFAFSFTGDDEVIVWNKNRPLTWQDYKGKPQKRFAAASTVYSLGRKVLTQNDTLYARIQAYFYCYDSWKKDEWISESVLRHEQKHFDIVELFCRKMRKRVSEMTFKNFKDAEVKVDSLYEIYNAELDIYQDRYDDETDGSMDREGQVKWSGKINSELQLFDKYEAIFIPLTLKK